ncbi:putative GTP cyclohydrolase-2 [Talaromyces atroroseus]|uniref:GTP cyclohydrolase II n=1 Tax=Talaromyces atroroseus TaxID=1441469 RepID=A0A225AQK8_TALAT|nr:putative GTP cyclohydrolase-2 [Talaromyces atroroseus]OKL63902.1 putative GTP cyclohydrolase-2 [Talaromyces atroroseus]
MAEKSPYIAPQPRRPNVPLAALDNSDRGDSSTITPESHGIDSHRSLLARALGNEASANATPALPESIISPAFTPPSTPGGSVVISQQAIRVHPHDASSSHKTQAHVPKGPKLMERLPHVECIVRARIPTTTGAEMFLHLYQNDADNKEHLAIVFGNHIRSRSLDRVQEGETEMDRMIRGAYVGRLHPGRVSSRFDEPHSSLGPEGEGVAKQGLQAPLVRIHSECYTGETAWSARCDCGEQLDEAARLMSMASESAAGLSVNEDGSISDNTSPLSSPVSDNDGPGGVIIYLRQEGRGIGLGEKLKAYNLQDLGSDTVEANLLLRHPADARSYGLATAMLVDLGLGADAYPEGIRLLTNNPDKVLAVEGPNREVRVKERVAMIPIAWRTGGQKGIRSREIEGYLQTKVGIPSQAYVQAFDSS